MLLLLIRLYYAKALPEAFELMKNAAQRPSTDSARVRAEAWTGK